jgi:hypothetical protein
MSYFESTPHEPNLPPGYGDLTPPYDNGYSDGVDAGLPAPHELEVPVAGTGDAYGDSGIVPGPDDVPEHSIEGSRDMPASGGRVEGVADRPPKPVVSFEEIAAQRRQPIMERLGPFNDETGVDTERVDHFAAALDLKPPRNHLILPQERIADLVRAFDQAGIETSSLVGGAGRYVRSLGLTVVTKNLRMPPWWSESTLVHEKVGHGSQGESDQPSIHLSDEQLRLWKPLDGKHRGGFTNDRGEGVFMEEGFSHVLAAEYGQRTGLDVTENGPFSIDNTAPDKYRTAKDYNPAAIAMEVLFARDPELIELAFKSRQDDEAYNDMMHRIRQIDLGLPSVMMGVVADDWGGATGELFDEGLDMVLTATGFGREDIMDIANEGPVTQYIARKLAAYEQATGYRFNDQRQNY